jgi:putative ATP-binding cassette transporter
MELLRFAFRSSLPLMLGVVIASLLSGAASAAVIAVIHHALTLHDTAYGLLIAAFIAAAGIKTATHYVSQWMLVRFGQDSILQLCRSVCDRVLAAPLDRLEAMGSARLLATLNDDVAVLSAAVQILPSLATNVAVLAGCSIYLVWLSWPLYLICVLMVAAGALGYKLLMDRAHASIHAARDGRDRLFGDFRSLIEGIKELKLNRRRRHEFMTDEVATTTESLRALNVEAMRKLLTADTWNQLLFLGLVAMLLFVAPSFVQFTPQTLSGYVFALLYMMAPLWSLVGTVPTFMRGRVAMNKIHELGAALDTSGPPPAAPVAAEAPLRIDLQRAVYAHPSPAGDEPGFALGPIDLTLAHGELLFITGGNGSGKSTLVRLLTGLYAPQSGQVLINGEPVDDSSRDAYRQRFAAVFADFHLFDRLFGVDAPARGELIAHYLHLLGIDRKVRIEGDRLSTTALSSGQRRRLALLTAYLEDRPVYVFDEWAADQDPAYKEIFYLQLLPELKARGKCVVVVTHDDRYFKLGDRVVKLENGRIASIEANDAPRRAATRLSSVQTSA